MIRRAGPADSAVFATLQIESWRETFRGQVPEDVLARFSESLRTVIWKNMFQAVPPIWAFLAEATNGDALGCIAGSLRHSSNGRAAGEVEAIHILGEAQRQGIGRALLLKLLAEMREGGVESVVLWVLKESERGSQFCTRLGGIPGRELRETEAGHQFILAGYEWPDISALHDMLRAANS